MSRRRTFTRREIFDAAKAAADNGLLARLTTEGDIEFTTAPVKRKPTPTPEEALEGWLNGREARGHP